MGGKLAEKENERALKELLIHTIGSFTFRASSEDLPHLADKVIETMKSNDFAFVTQAQIAKYQWEQAQHLEKAWQDNNAIDKNYADLTNEILENSCESCWDGDDSAHKIAVDYVRFLEKYPERKGHKEGCYYANESS